MSGVPYTFGTATTSIPLSNLDSNFVTPVTIGNASVALGNTISTIGNLTLNNVTINGGTINASVTGSYSLANAVVYSNSSNVGVTSANLTFDGTTLTSLNTAYTGTLTGGTGVVNLGSGQFYKDASGNVRIGAGQLLVNNTNNRGTGQIGVAFASGTYGIGYDYTTGSGGAFFTNFLYGGATCGFIYTASGSVTVYSTTSDYRLKENVVPMTGALATISALKPCTYTWKTDGSDGQGFIAHELAKVCPEAVVGEKDAVDKEGKPVYQGIDTSFLVATLTAAIQEQQALITNLTTRLTALENK